MEVLEKPKTNGKYFTHEHILEVQRKKGRELPIDLIYDPEIFWKSIGDNFYKNFVKREQYQIGIGWLVDRLKVLNVESLLDVGTGFGRVLPFLLDAGVIKSALGIDISEELLKCSEEYLSPVDEVWCREIKLVDGKWMFGEQVADDWVNCPKCGILRPKKLDKKAPDFRDRITVKHGDVRKMDIPSDSYDCVLSFECLQHLPPEQVDEALAEIVRVSKRVVILCERWAFPGERFEPHFFSHNLAEKLGNMGLNLAQVSSVGNGLQGVIAIKR